VSRRSGSTPNVASPRWTATDVVRAGLLVAVGTLVMLGWLTPAEAAADGETLPRALVWMVVAAVWLWLPRVGSLGSTRLADMGVALFVGGHVVSGLVVLAAEGQKRYSANLMVEWLGLGCAWLVLREFVAVRAWRRALSTLLLAAATTAAGLGIWQHQVTLPRMATEYGPKIAAVREALARGETHPFMRELAAVGVPTSEPGLTLYEKRLRDSTEPFGMFALANTLGGLLAAAIVWGTACVIGGYDRRQPRWWLAVVSVGLMAVCLVLTKSRTATVALAGGWALVGVAFLRARGWSLGRMLLGGMAAIVVVLGLAAGALAVGAWDREVLAEAPKSLGYRWLYWQGSARLIAERPLLGVGLGQFRPAYLRVKSPEASEEIADPHNLLLDAWVNGGLLAMLGLGLCGVSLFRREKWADSATASNEPTAGGVIGGGALAPALLLATESWSDAVIVMGLAWLACAWVWRPFAATGVGSLAALLTLGVHLLGAGGGGMPAVVLFGLILLAMSVTCDSPVPSTAAVAPSGWRRRLTGGGLAVLTVVTALGLWQPDVACRELIAAGDNAATRGDWERAAMHYQQAAERDRTNPIPAGRFAEVQHRSALSPGLDDRERRQRLDRAVAGLMLAAQRDPANGEWDHQLGECRRAVYRLTKSPRDAAMAAEEYRRAWQKSPTNAAWAADWAAAAFAAGQFDEARRAAEIALKQDDLNRRLGHVERWLSEARRNELTNWAVGTGENSPLP
jgi:hypothetical protein